MTRDLSSVIATRLEKIALDNGFDQPRAAATGWLHFASSRVPLHIWLTTTPDDHPVACFSQSNVAGELGEHGAPFLSPLPEGACKGLVATDIPELHRIVRRAFQLSRSLPDELHSRFQDETSALPTTTEAERLVVQRVGQDIFRRGLIDYWDGRCAVTGLGLTEILRASHIKPWAKCVSDLERLDVFNGILLAPQLDAVFDRGLITFQDSGQIAISSMLASHDLKVLGITMSLRVNGLAEEHKSYLAFHRSVEFQP